MPRFTNRVITWAMGSRGGLVLRTLIRRSPKLTNIGVRVLGRLEALRDDSLSSSERWTARTPDEVRYWTDALRSPEARVRFADRLDPGTEITGPALKRAVEEIVATDIKILDVGSGPLTWVGKTYPGKQIKVVAIDPLAEDYVGILRDCQLDPPILPTACSGEEIVRRFGAKSFDIAFALNALDHSVDPLLVLEDMLTATNPVGRVALTHMRNEGERNAYFGIHFWNVDCRGGHFLIGNPTASYDVTERLKDRFEVECWDSGDELIHCLIRALPELSPH